MTALNVRKRGVAVVENGSWAPAAGKEMERIRDLVKKYDLFLFSDERCV